MVTLALLIGLDYGVSVYCYNNVFGKRLDTYEPTALKVSDFEGLNATHYDFPSDKGHSYVFNDMTYIDEFYDKDQFFNISEIVLNKCKTDPIE